MPGTEPGQHREEVMHTHLSAKEPDLLLTLPCGATCKAQNEVAQVTSGPLLQLEHCSPSEKWEQTKLKN